MNFAGLLGYIQSPSRLPVYLLQGILKGEVSLYHWPPVWLIWNQLYEQLTIFVFYFQNRLIQTSQTGGQWYSDTSPFSFPCLLSAFIVPAFHPAGPSATLPACLPTLQIFPSCKSTSQYVCLSARLPVCLPACLPACLSARLPVCPPACLPACLSARLPVYPPACLPACLSVNIQLTSLADPSYVPWKSIPHATTDRRIRPADYRIDVEIDLW